MPNEKKPGTNRRHILKALGLTFAGTLAAGHSSKQAIAATSAAGHHVTDAPIGDNHFDQKQNFYGRYQSGIINERPAHGLIASFDVLVKNPAELERL